MLPFAAVLAIASLGQTLVVHAGRHRPLGGRRTVARRRDHHPRTRRATTRRLLPALVIALLAAVAWPGSVNGFLIGRLGLNPIVATLGTNALLYRRGALVIGRHPADDHRPARRGSPAGRLRDSERRLLRRRRTAVVTTVGQADARRPPLRGRRGEQPSRPARPGCGSRATAAGAYVWAQLLYWLAAVLLAGIVNQPTAYQGDTYLLPSVAAVVLGGTSLLGGRGNLVATAVAALFLSQLEQFVLALGVTFAARTLVQAAALAIGVALYTVDWRCGIADGASPERAPRPRRPT